MSNCLNCQYLVFMKNPNKNPLAEDSVNGMKGGIFIKDRQSLVQFKLKDTITDRGRLVKEVLSN